MSKSVMFYEVDIMPPFYVKLYHSLKKIKRDLKKKDYCTDDIPDDVPAFTCSLTANGQTPIACVYINPDMCEDSTDAEIYAVLAHEATHCVDGYFEVLGETNPSSELKAYAIQSVCGLLFHRHRKWTKKQKHKNKNKGR